MIINLNEGSTFYLPHYGDFNMLGPESDTIRRCGLVGVGMALLEEVGHCKVGL